jgi:hypothetical protein
MYRRSRLGRDEDGRGEFEGRGDQVYGHGDVSGFTRAFRRGDLYDWPCLICSG